VQIRAIAYVALGLALAGCPSEEPSSPDPTPTPDAPVCGDGAVDASLNEQCDDGELFGGDGCSPTCQDEILPGESESNDAPEDANALPPGGAVIGGLPRGDTDCFSVPLADAGWIAADVTGEDPAQCPEDVVLRLFDPAGNQVATGTPGMLGCSGIDPVQDPAARFVEAGVWTVCAEGFLGRPVPTYTLDVVVGADSCTLDFPFTIAEDPDSDGTPNTCDLDDDGDGYDDTEDNCPEAPNGDNNPPLTVDASGFLRTWLIAGPYADLPAGGEGGSCEVSDVDPLTDEASAFPQLGQPAGDLTWFAYFDSNARLNFLHLMGGPTPREVYATAWVRSPVAQTASLAMGIDDGGRAYWNGEQVFEVGSCQGTNVDQFQAPVDMAAGWNQLLIRVRDQGGGWALYARFLDGAGEPILGLEVSLTGPEPFSPDQTDTDGDGQGDWCDETPNGE